MRASQRLAGHFYDSKGEDTMRRISVLTMVAVVFCMLCALSPAGEAAGKAIAVVSVGPVDEALVERVVAFARSNTALRVSPARKVECSETSLDAIGKKALESLGEDEVVMVVLAWPDEAVEAHGWRLPESAVSVVNVRSLKTDGVTDEVFARRVEKQTMLSIGMLLGMEACPNPQCALWDYSTLEELDSKGRNHCPPCLDRLQKKAVEKGVELDLDSPFRMR